MSFSSPSCCEESRAKRTVRGMWQGKASGVGWWVVNRISSIGGMNRFKMRKNENKRIK